MHDIWPMQVCPKGWIDKTAFCIGLGNDLLRNAILLVCLCLCMCVCIHCCSLYVCACACIFPLHKSESEGYIKACLISADDVLLTTKPYSKRRWWQEKNVYALFNGPLWMMGKFCCPRSRYISQVLHLNPKWKCI